jgi:outer membrane protein OmpA-like peptidoglycan-associated protein
VDVPDLRVEADPRGVKLTLENLKFVADQAELLPGEDKRLAAIADLLKTVPNRNLLVVGHTAAVGSVESQDSLSIQRAKSIVDKLKTAGIPAQRLLYEGRGGRDPVAPNETEAGRSQNRRVEILILDQ